MSSEKEHLRKNVCPLVPHFMSDDEDGLIVVALVDGAAVVPVAHARNPGEAYHRILRLVSVVQI